MEPVQYEAALAIAGAISNSPKEKLHYVWRVLNRRDDMTWVMFLKGHIEHHNVMKFPDLTFSVCFSETISSLHQ